MRKPCVNRCSRLYLVRIFFTGSHQKALAAIGKRREKASFSSMANNWIFLDNINKLDLYNHLLQNVKSSF